MIVEIKIPSPGESITEVEIASWLKSNGDYVELDQEIAEIESDKATLTLNAEVAGVLQIVAEEGVINVGDIACKIDTSATKGSGSTETVQETSSKQNESSPAPQQSSGQVKAIPSISAKKMIDEGNLNQKEIGGTGKDGRITKGDVLQFQSKTPSTSTPSKTNSEAPKVVGERSIERVKMSLLRKKVAERLVAVKNETAMLTTFNEVDLSAIKTIRAQYKEKFREIYDVNLGFMSFFTKAVTESLKEYRAVNSQIEGGEILYHNYMDISIAVSAPKGLMVPVIRNAESLSLSGIEQEVLRLAKKARDGKLTVNDMTGGTFTITNGGVFGSLLSTPIINPPQTAILGMHTIQERPVAIKGEVKIRPMMYIALSYDHRVIDGKESVSFLKNVKELLEDPIRLLIGV